jgi:hypothetical protein
MSISTGPNFVGYGESRATEINFIISPSINLHLHLGLRVNFQQLRKYHLVHQASKVVDQYYSALGSNHDLLAFRHDILCRHNTATNNSLARVHVCWEYPRQTHRVGLWVGYHSRAGGNHLATAVAHHGKVTIIFRGEGVKLFLFPHVPDYSECQSAVHILCKYFIFLNVICTLDIWIATLAYRCSKGPYKNHWKSR